MAARFINKIQNTMGFIYFTYTHARVHTLSLSRCKNVTEKTLPKRINETIDLSTKTLFATVKMADFPLGSPEQGQWQFQHSQLREWPLTALKHPNQANLTARKVALEAMGGSHT